MLSFIVKIIWMILILMDCIYISVSHTLPRTSGAYTHACTRRVICLFCCAYKDYRYMSLYISIKLRRPFVLSVRAWKGKYLYRSTLLMIGYGVNVNEICHWCVQEISLVTASERRSWQLLPREKYPKPLIFHDGRLAFNPTPLNSLALFIWIPIGFPLAVIKAFIALTLPYTISLPMLGYLGMRFTISEPEYQDQRVKQSKHILYVCNHRTLLDPLYLTFALKKKVTAVTYSLSRMSEIISPIRTVRLTRNRDQDRKMMEKLLNQGDLAVCPEGTTCREPYLLRFSPLFAEMSDFIVPVASSSHVTMFHGTTASGLKCLDPLFFLMNPSSSYTMHFLESVSGSSRCHDDLSGWSRYDVANYVQKQVGEALGFECTQLTRRDKYQILVGNDGLTRTAWVSWIILK